MRNPSWRRRLTMLEPLTGRGEVLLSLSHVLLLHGLYDRPDGIAHSQRDWLLASAPYATQSGARVGGLFRGSQTIHPAWVKRKRIGNRVVCMLTPRGRAIVEREVPAYVRGRGVYRGLRELVRG